MQIYDGHADPRLRPAPSAVALGVFDGVHLGHQRLLAEVDHLATAASPALRRVAYTFHPHPAVLLRPSLAPALIEPVDRRLARLARRGVEATVVEPFDAALRDMRAADFFHQVLVGRLGARAVVVGEGFRFGRGQEGEVAALTALGAPLGVRVVGVGHVRQGGVEVSSTKVRAYVQAGQVDGAALLLGRRFEMSGRVVAGDRRGRSLGFPTANLAIFGELAPARGVYAAMAQVGALRRPAVVNVGTAPTFGASTTVRVEAHLLDHDGGAFYGAEVVLELVARLREERRFGGPEALVAQIGRDVVEARRALREAGEGGEPGR